MENLYVNRLILDYLPTCGDEIAQYSHQAEFMKLSKLNPCGKKYTAENCTCEYATKRTQIIERAIVEWVGDGKCGGYESFNYGDEEFQMFGDIQAALGHELDKYHLEHPVEWYGKIYTGVKIESNMETYRYIVEKNKRKLAIVIGH